MSDDYEWAQNDATRAGGMGWTLRPFRYVEEDGCWTILRSEPSPLNTDEEAAKLVLRLGACRDFCENEPQWKTCQKAAMLAMGISREKI